MDKVIYLDKFRELLAPIKRMIDRKAESPSWNENDPASASYIKDRPFYTYEEVQKGCVLIPETTFVGKGDPDFPVYISEIQLAFNEDVVDPDDVFLGVVEITFDGKVYERKAFNLEESWSLGAWGNPYFWGFDSEQDNGDPFAIIAQGLIAVLDDKEHTVSMKLPDTVVQVDKKIDKKYLPDIGVGRKGTGDGAEIFNDYENNVAEGRYSHAEGYETTAGGSYSHAEGGYTVADGQNSHAEGGSTRAGGGYSHAEGYNTVAERRCSHAEGDHTVATADNQHVQGRYNVEDEKEEYLHIVGNGNYTGRSNAHTIDKVGNAWFSGNVKVGGVSQYSGDAELLVTESKLYAPKQGMIFEDNTNGSRYIVGINGGNLVTYSAIKNIKVTTNPTKTRYMAGDYFDCTGMVVTATTYDGVTKEVDAYIIQPDYFRTSDLYVTVAYSECGFVHTTFVEIAVTEFDPSVALIDFNYTANDNGTYTIDSWKETLNGEPSDKIVVPNNAFVVV